MGRTRSRRQAIARKLDPYVTIYVEGETEKLYFSRFRQIFQFSGPEIVCYTGAKLGIVDWVIKKQRQMPKAEKEASYVFILLDLDVFTENEYDQICKEAKKEGFRVFGCKPSFEIWLMAHHEQIKPSMSKETILRKLDTAFGGKYRKTHPQIGELADDYKKAITNVRLIKNLNFDQNFNYTNIDDMIQEIKSICDPNKTKS